MTRIVLSFLALLATLLVPFQPASLSYGQETPQGAPPPAGAVETQARAEHIAGELLVKFKDGLSPHGAEHLLARQGAIATEFYPNTGVYRVRLDSKVSVAQGVASLRADPHIAYTEPNYVVKVLPHWHSSVNDPHLVDLWGLHNTGQTGGTPDADIDAPEAWAFSRGSDRVVVAVLDTGVDYTHLDLEVNIWRNPMEVPANGLDDDGNGYVDDIHGIDTFAGDSDPMDDNGHGTHVAGTIGAVGNNGTGVVGVNWRVKLLALKFMGADGIGTIAGAVQALDYIIDIKLNHGVNVRLVSNSWAGGGFSQALHDAIAAAYRADILFVAAAGNAATDNDLLPSYPASYDLPNVVAVAASDHTDAPAAFTNWGSRTVHLAAPGVDVVSTTPDNTYGAFSGTSMATPHVSGVAALIYAARPWYTVQQVRRTLLSSVDRKDAWDSRTLTGGRINARTAVAGGSRGIVLLASAPDYGTLVEKGRPVTIEVEAILGSRAVLDARVTASLSTGEPPVALSDRGIAPDRVAGDGVYAGSWLPSKLGPVLVKVAAVRNGVPSGAKYLPVAVMTAVPAYKVVEVPYQWTDIAATGIRMDMGDDTAVTIPLPFPVTFYGRAFPELTIGSNGQVNVEGAYLGHINSPVPSANDYGVGGFIAVLWDDLIMEPSVPHGMVFWQVLGQAPDRTLIVQWHDVGHYSDSDGVTFQLVLREGDDTIVMRYKDVDFGDPSYNGGASATVGVQLDAENGTQFSFEAPILRNEMAIAFYTGDKPPL